MGQKHGIGESLTSLSVSKLASHGAAPTLGPRLLSRGTADLKGNSSELAVSGRYHVAPKKLDDDYQIDSGMVLGSGCNGSVYMATNKTTKEKCAVKPFKIHGVSKKKKAEIAAECEIFLAMDHPHIGRLVDVYEGQEELCLVMECMSGGELFDRVAERRRFSERDAANAIRMMLLAVNYIHRHQVVHRDLKLENFLYESKDSDHLKLIDFGFSKIWKKNTKMDLSCGTLAYVAPEVLDQSYTSQCDLWSLGVIVFILLVGYMPFSGAEEKQVKSIQKGQYHWKPQKWGSISAHGQDFTKALLVVNPQKRLTADQALKHPFLEETNRQTACNNDIDHEMVDALCRFGQASAMRRACMEVMAWSLSNSERRKLRDAFLEMDSQKTGTISLSEFRMVLEDQFHISDEKVVTAFKALDYDNADEIHYSEFLAATASTRIAMHDDLLKLTFKRFDTDNSGFITVANLKEVLGESYNGDEIEKMLSEADVHHLGQISLEDFMHYMRDPEVHEAHLDAAGGIVDQSINRGDKADSARLRLKTVHLEDKADPLAPIQVNAKQTSPAKKCCAIL